MPKKYAFYKEGKSRNKCKEEISKMKRLRQYLAKPLNTDKAADKEQLSKWGISIRYAPDPPENFDEFEFGLDYQDHQDVAFVTTIEKGEIKRMMFGRPDKDNPEILRPMDDNTIADLMKKKGGDILAFFDFITS